MRTVMTVCVLTRRGCEIKEEEEIRKRFSSFNRERITRMLLRRSIEFNFPRLYKRDNIIFLIILKN